MCQSQEQKLHTQFWDPFQTFLSAIPTIVPAASAYLEDSAVCVIELVAGVLLELTVLAIHRIRLHDPIGPIACHAMCRAFNGSLRLGKAHW